MCGSILCASLLPSYRFSFWFQWYRTCFFSGVSVSNLALDISSSSILSSFSLYSPLVRSGTAYHLYLTTRPRLSLSHHFLVSHSMCSEAIWLTWIHWLACKGQLNGSNGSHLHVGASRVSSKPNSPSTLVLTLTFLKNSLVTRLATFFLTTALVNPSICTYLQGLTMHLGLIQ